MFQLQWIPMKIPESYLCDTREPKSLGAVLPHAAPQYSSATSRTSSASAQTLHKKLVVFE